MSTSGEGKSPLAAVRAWPNPLVAVRAVETSQAGPGNLEVTVNGGRVPTSAQAQGPHTYAISFTPRESAPHTVDLRFNGEDVPGSPFHVHVAQAARVVVASEGLEKVAVDRPASFTVESDAAGAAQAPDVQVLSPSRRPLLVDVASQGQGRYAVHFTPTDVGDHSVEVKVGGAHVEGSPFLVKAYDAAKVKVTDINTGTVGKPVFFSSEYPTHSGCAIGYDLAVLTQVIFSQSTPARPEPATSKSSSLSTAATYPTTCSPRATPSSKSTSSRRRRRHTASACASTASPSPVRITALSALVTSREPSRLGASL